MTTAEAIEFLAEEGVYVHSAELQHGIDSGAITQPKDVAIRDMDWGGWELSQARVYLDRLCFASRALRSFRATVYLDANEVILPNANMVVDIDAMDGVLNVTVDDLAARVEPGVPAGVSSDIHVPFS